jgi:hypothetical protein
MNPDCYLNGALVGIWVFGERPGNPAVRRIAPVGSETDTRSGDRQLKLSPITQLANYLWLISHVRDVIRSLVSRLVCRTA